MKKHLFLLASLALGMAACTNDTLLPDNDAENTAPDQETTVSNLQTAKLAVYNSNTNRLIYETATRDEEDKVLALVATIENPDQEVLSNYSKDKTGTRMMSATSVSKNPNDGKYYVTYHMQGNNYNTTLDNDIAGAIQEYSITNGEVILGNVFTSENRDKEDFDFNHLYYDVTDKRIIAVGHNWKVHNDGSEDPNHENTTAIIAKFNPNDGSLNYKQIFTDEKILDDEGKSRGNKDAGDANCVIRAGETNILSQTGWNFYYVATRKGMAILRAEEDHLFDPALDEDGKIYFISTPGSAKYVAKTGTSSYFKLLYLAENKTNNSYNTSSSAKIAQFATNTSINNTFGSLQTQHVPTVRFDFSSEILNFQDQITLDQISPIDGKNTILANPGESNGYDDEIYAALGTGGLYYQFSGVNSFQPITGILKFKGSSKYLPVNCVYVDHSDRETGHDGFIYVACGSRLVILHRATFEIVAYWNMPSVDENENSIESSANFIHIEKESANDNWTARERTITVAFGQAGVKVFKFNPSLLEKKTVWEKELPAEISIH